MCRIPFSIYCHNRKARMIPIIHKQTEPEMIPENGLGGREQLFVQCLCEALSADTVSTDSDL